MPSKATSSPLARVFLKINAPAVPGISLSLISVRRFLDVLKIERNVNSHRLEATYKRSTSQSLDGAHDALSDIRATVTIFEKQLEQNPNLPTSIPDLEELCRGDNGRVDFAGKLYEKEGLVYWSFGKHKDQLVTETREYVHWVLGSDFPHETKKQLRRLLDMANS